MNRARPMAARLKTVVNSNITSKHDRGGFGEFDTVM